ncbi:phosphotransferase family protein [Rubrobacter taiwanensis]|jgi:aminoglycoside phosphotransferase (APT) family kinase protein|uniref:Phosphotransferase family protein n=1 Tax=Rubrobacter taiwanensis TaxID=185139 RepID=A0A4R1BLP6_9ACTN|nr:phosphotransferase family protein [Rubrobacter taiwanensis]TCJ18365.1 phosphotransferase family protein [Rubrobacter taiwanensis]
MAGEQRGETIPVREGEELDLGAVGRYLRANVEGVPEGELVVRQFPAGASNLTYLLRVGDWEAVLRRPPFGPVPPKAHDMIREASILLRLHPVYPLAPKPYAICEDESVIGAPFYIMERRKGVVLDDSFPEGCEPTRELCRQISASTVETIAELHAIDWEAAGLGDIGYPEGFLERQVRGWISRYEKAKTGEMEEVGPLTAWISANVPQSPPATVIHNDFKLNNMILDPQNLSRVVAVLDWEMTTIGDPLFDLAVTLSYWVEPDDPEEIRSVLPAVTDTPGFMTREEFMQLYARLSGRDLSEMHFYLTFAYFKLAVILQQIYARYAKGQTRDSRFADFGRRAEGVIRHAHQLAAAGGA